MKLTDQLQLEQVIEPAGIASWPPAPGWWLAALLLALSLGAGLFLCVRLYRKAKRKKTARAALSHEYQQWQKVQGDLMGRLNLIMKRTCLTRYPKIRYFSQSEWKVFLRQHLPAKEHDALEGFFRQLYQANPQECQERAYQDVSRWLRKLPC